MNKIVDTKWNSNRRDFDLVHMHTFGPKAMIYKKLVNSKKIITAHSTPRLNENNFAGDINLSVFYKRMYNGFDHVIAVTDFCKSELIDLGVKAPITVIPNCIDLDKFKYSDAKRKSFREKYEISEENKVVLTVAQQTPRKGIYDFIKIAEKSTDSNVKFVWVGDMPYSFLSKDFLKINRLKEKCGGNVIFPGFVDDIVEAYCGADVFLMPSYAEGMPIVILEAMATETKIIARNIPEFRECFENDVLFFDGIEDACDMIHKVLNSLNGRKKTHNTACYDMHTIARSHLELYNSIL